MTSMDRESKYPPLCCMLFAAAATILTLMPAVSMAQGILGGNLSKCPPSLSDDRKDYRLRETTPTLKWKARDTYENHLAPALRRMQGGDYSTAVIDDLNFLLERWPNHYPALQALLKYEAAGGNMNKYVQVSCYFQRANWFVPDDANIFVLNGIYRHKAKDYKGAEESWKHALSIDSNSADAHYNLGLLYVQFEDFPNAVKHAEIAYELGYPLPGLKAKLASMGHTETSRVDPMP